jgi:hypothetical protein
MSADRIFAIAACALVGGMAFLFLLGIVVGWIIERLPPHHPRNKPMSINPRRPYIGTGAFYAARTVSPSPERSGEPEALVQQFRGRAAFLRDDGHIKSPELMEQAADALESAQAEIARLTAALEGLIGYGEHDDMCAVNAYASSGQHAIYGAIRATHEPSPVARSWPFGSRLKENEMDSTELRALGERLADEIDKQADERRERAINAASMKYDMNNAEEVDRWTVAFSTSYQTLRGLAAAIRSTVDEK